MTASAPSVRSLTVATRYGSPFGASGFTLIATLPGPGVYRIKVAAAVGLGVGALAIAGAPAVVVTGVLGSAAVIGGSVTLYTTGSAAANGNWNGVAYNMGAVAGGSVVGATGGNALARAITSTATKGWSYARDMRNLFNPKLCTTGQWLATGPDGGAAAGSMATAGPGVSRFGKGGC